MRRGIELSLLVTCSAVIALCSGFALMLFNHSQAFTFWMVGFPIAATVIAVALLRRSRGLVRGATAALVLGFDALVVFGQVDRFDCGQRWEDAPDVRAVAQIVPGFALRDDGKGAYIDATDRVETYMHHLLTVAVPMNGKSPRTLQLDLSKPVAGSGAVALGTISDVVWIKSYWYQDADHLIHAVKSIREDTTVVSDRTDILLRIDGRKHRLTFGPWAGRYCDAEPGVGGAGTSAVSVTRAKGDAYEVVAAPGSRARLWDVSAGAGPLGPRRATDKGLYQVDFRIVYRAR